MLLPSNNSPAKSLLWIGNGVGYHREIAAAVMAEYCTLLFDAGVVELMTVPDGSLQDGRRYSYHLPTIGRSALCLHRRSPESTVDRTDVTSRQALSDCCSGKWHAGPIGGLAPLYG